MNYLDGLEMREDFDTPPESPDELKIELSPEVEAELEELQSTEDFITKNQESIARSAGMAILYLSPDIILKFSKASRILCDNDIVSDC